MFVRFRPLGVDVEYGCLNRKGTLALVQFRSRSQASMVRQTLSAQIDGTVHPNGKFFIVWVMVLDKVAIIKKYANYL